MTNVVMTTNGGNAQFVYFAKPAFLPGNTARARCDAA